MKILVKSSSGRIPKYFSEGACAADLAACISENLIVHPGCRVKVPTGVAIAIPEGYAGLVMGRSSVGFQGLLVIPGLVDRDFRGEISVVVVNLTDWPFVIKDGLRIGQLMLQPVVRANFELVQTLDSTVRGEGGFGSTGSV